MKYIYYFFCVILLIPAVIVSTIFGLLPASIIRALGYKQRAKKIYIKWVSFLANNILFVLNYKVHINGIENLPKDRKNLVFISNHLSVIDLCVYYGKLDFRAAAVAKKEISKFPILKQYAKGMDCILIDRKSPKSSIKAILDATNELKRGGEVLIFPEGTRSKTGEVGTLKAGSFKMALRAKSTIVPLVIKGVRKGFEERKGLHRTHTYVEILPPVSVENLTKEEQKEIPCSVSDQIKAKFAQMPSK